MFLTNLEQILARINEIAWSWPLVIFVIGTAILLTVGLNFVQFRYFFQSWQYAFAAEESEQKGSENYITPFQAFLNALSASLGNGAAAGMATAVFYGGPGVGFWIFTLSFFTLAIRFAEVFAGTYFTEKTAAGVIRGGPMVYLSKVPGGSFLPAAYAFFCLLLTFCSGNAMQCNSIAVGINRLTGINLWIIAFVLFSFIVYLMLGGAQRIMYFSEKIVPIKVVLFFFGAAIVLIYNYQAIIPALKIILQGAFTPQVLRGVVAGYTVQNAIRFGVSRSLNATEVGLGTAGILFGATGSKNPMRSAVMSMATAFISNQLVCTVLVIMLVATGVWTSGLNSSAMTQAAFETVSTTFGGLIVSFLTISFGMGVLIAYAYMGRECWAYLTGGRFMRLYTIIFCLTTFVGCLASVRLIWDTVDIVNAGLLTTNLFGLVWLLPRISKAVKSATKTT